MKKTNYLRELLGGRLDRDSIWLRIRLLCMFLMCLGTSTSVVQAQNTERISVVVREKTIAEILNIIEKETKCVFLYDEEVKEHLLQKVVSIDMKEKSIDHIMKKLLHNTGLSYKISQRQILIYNAHPVKVSHPIEGQVIQISSCVVDETGEVLIGANIQILENQVGTTTDINGYFSLRVPSESSHIRISYLGYEPLVLKASQIGKEITMYPAKTDLSEIVVNGYSNIDKRLSASATTTLNADDIMIPNVPTLSGMLQGTVSGLTVMASSGSPNEAPKIRMRGSATIHGDAAPVWVIDGVIWEETVDITNDEVNAILRGNSSLDQVNENASISLLGNAITGLNPHDIESITFLKDASATAIYGTRAANGVIVVTTKKGREGKTSVNFSSSWGLTSRPTYKDYKMMNSKQRIGVSKDMVSNGYLFDIVPYDTGYEGALFALLNKEITDDEFAARVSELEMRNTDWFDLLCQNSLNQDYNLNISGGTSSTTYYVSLGYSDNKGTVKGDNMKRYNFKMNLNTHLWKFLNVGTQLSYSDRKSTGFYMVNPFDYALYTSRALDPDEFYEMSETRVEGTKNNYTLKYNIFNEINHTSNVTNVRDMNVQMNLSANILKGLSAEALFSFRYANTNQRQWADEQSYYIAGIRGYDYGSVLPGSADELASKLPKGGILIDSNQDQESWTARFSLNYNTVFRDDHVINAMLGYEARSTQYEGLKEQEYGYSPNRGNKVNHEYNNHVSGSTDIYTSSLDKHHATITNTLSNTLSGFATLSYSYKGKYILNGNVRMDASNRFGQYTNNRFLPIWSLAGRWNIAEEDWMPQFVNDLSLRASYGMQGNIPTSVGPNLVVSYPSTTINRWSGEYVLQISRLPYPNLRWEKTHTVNLGLEFSLLDNRIMACLDYYWKKSTDVLFQLPVGLEYGVEQIYRNGADLTNRGVELSMTVIPIRTKDWEWTISPIWSKNDNEVTNAIKSEYTVNDYLSGNAYENGKPVNAIYSWKFTGVDSETGYATFANTYKTSEEASESKNIEDLLVYSGSKDPKFSGGFSTTLRWKNLLLSTQWAFQFGNVIRMNYLFEGESLMPQPYQNLNVNLAKAWKQPGDEKFTNIPAFNVSGEYDYNVYYNYNSQVRSTNTYTMYNYSDLRVASGDFLRCRNLSLTYSFPYNQIEKYGLTSMSLGLNVTNPFTFCSSKLDGQDPEISATGTTAMPITQTYTISLNLSF